MSAPTIAVVGFIAITLILLGLAGVILWKIVTNEIKLDGLISEPWDPVDKDRTPKASLSRFQFLVFTFVIAGLYLMLCIEAGSFIDIPNNVLGLLGISGGSFVVSKAVGLRKPNGEEGKPKPGAGGA